MDGPRPPRPLELDDLTTLLMEVFGFFREHSSYARLRRRLGTRARMRNTLVIAEDGKPVSHVHTVRDRISVLGCPVKVASVSSVCTHPDLRGRGFAAAILEMAIADMKAAGARIVVVSGDRGLYRRAGCIPAGLMLHGHVHRGSLPTAPSGLTVCRTDPHDWPRLAPLHQAEPVRFRRTRDDLARLSAQWAGSPADLWLVEAQRQPLAYVWLGPLWSTPRSRARDVCEYAGSRAAIVEAIPLILEAADIEEIGAVVLGHDRELAYLLASRGIELAPITLAGTLGLLDLPGLMRDLRPYLAARLPRADLRRLSFDQRGGSCVLQFCEDRLELPAPQATLRVLGSPDSPSVGGELGRILADIFPVPFPTPGFNSV